jgi:hypothetical protein
MQKTRELQMLIETMPDLLTWANQSDGLDRIYDSYVALLSDKLGQTIGHVTRADAAAGERLTAMMRDLADESFMRVLTAPQTSYHLLCPGRHPLDETAQFLRQSFFAEMARMNPSIAIEEEVWTALGDMRLRPGGEVFRARQIEGMMSLDFDSPYASLAAPDGEDAMVHPTVEVFAEAEKHLVVGRIEAAKDEMLRTSQTAVNFVSKITRTLVLQKRPETPNAFTSNTSDEVIGRSVLRNPHVESATEADIADGIVHEAIHGILDMQEQQAPWVHKQELRGAEPRTLSPWTGNSLALRPFLQACFVWYGLLHFWGFALAAKTFTGEKVRSNISRAALGFLSRPLLEVVKDYRKEIAPGLLDAIEQMQTHVTAAYAGVR